MANKTVDAFLASEDGKAFGYMGKDAAEILAAFLGSSEREAGQLDQPAVDRALEWVVPRLKQVRLEDAPRLMGAFLEFAGRTESLKDAVGLADHARRRGADLAADDKDKRKPVVHAGPQVGRNDPCPCGSGKKYKKCCGGK